MAVTFSVWLHALHNHIALLLIAFVLSLALGSLQGLAARPGDPGRLRYAYHRFFRILEMKLNRRHRSRKARAVRGLVVLTFAVGLAVGMAMLVGRIEHLVAKGVLLDSFLIALLLPIRSLGEDMRAVYQSCLSHHDDRAHRILRGYAWRDTGVLDSYGTVRTGIEVLAVHFTTRILSPSLWYLLLGLPGFLLCRQVTMLARLFSHPSQRYEAFGWFMARGDRVLHVVPAQLTALLWVAASLFLPKGRPFDAWRLAFAKPHRLHRIYHGAPIAAAAGALHLSLAGPYSTHGAYVADPWVGVGPARAEPRELKRALMLYGIACLLCLLVLAVA